MMFDYDSRDSFLYAASLRLSMPRKVTKQKAEHHERMAEYWCKHARDLGRPGYHEHRGFSGTNTGGHERPYGPFSRQHWRYIRLAMRESFLAEWHRSQGTTYETTEGGRRSMAVLTGITG